LKVVRDPEKEVNERGEKSMIQTEEQLEELLSEPTPEVVEALSQLEGDILVLGVAGKMGPTLARMAKRASDAGGIRRRVIGVARFSEGGETALRAHGVETICCDLLNENHLARLPDASNVLFLAGKKFGSAGDEATTWVMNSYLPALVCHRFRNSRMVAFSTGNIYGLVPVVGAGSLEKDPPNPTGEYAMSCLARERVFEHFSRSFVIPVTVLRLNYACDLRYGVLVDLARRIDAGETIDLEMGYFNTIWQGDANAMALRAFAHVASPPWVVNVTGLEVLSVRAVSERLGKFMNRPVRFTGVESNTALLSNARLGLETLGPLRSNAEQLTEWVANWVGRAGRCLGKPTHFECRNGRF
jgi:nucleoside-diphosphate-sugar epimerase